MADLNDLQREWDAQPDYPEAKMNEIANLVRSRSDSMRSRLFRRDLGEAIACLIVIVVFGSFWSTAPNLVAKTGIAISIAGAVEIMVVLQTVRRRGRVDFAAVPLKEYIVAEIQGLNRQITLVRHVAWWYLLPCYLGASVVVIGIMSSPPRGAPRWIAGTLFCVGYLIVCLFLWRVNQKARRKNLEPLRDAMQRTYDSLVAMDAGGAQPEGDIVAVLADPQLDCQPGVGDWKFVKPGRNQVLVIVGAALVAMLPPLFWTNPDVGPAALQSAMSAIGAASIAWAATCVRRRDRKE